MTSVTRPRRPLPRRVYWFRRTLVLVVASAMVFAVGQLLEGEPGDDGDPSARPASSAGSTAVSSLPSGGATADSRPSRRPTNKAGKPRRVRTPLAMPTGPCQDSDVRVVPTLGGPAYAGNDVLLTLKLTTFASPACNWEVSNRSVAVKLTSGSDRIWSSQECRAAVPTVPVVLRTGKAAYVDVTWSARRSDSDCSRLTDWAVPGWYHVSAAALGSEPVTEQFELRAPTPETITPSPTPRGKGKPRTRG